MRAASENTLINHILCLFVILFFATAQSSAAAEKNRFKIVKKEIKSAQTEITYPEIQGMESKALQAKINGIFKEKAYGWWRSATTEEKKDTDYWANYSLTLNTKNIMCVVYDIQSYFHEAAHPNGEVSSVCVKTKDGAIVRLSDLFKKDSNYRSELTILMKADLEKRTETDDFNPLREFEGLEALKDTSGFYLSESDLFIYYQTYDYTVHAYGPLVFKIPISSIKYMLNKQFVF